MFFQVGKKSGGFELQGFPYIDFIRKQCFFFYFIVLMKSFFVRIKKGSSFRTKSNNIYRRQVMGNRLPVGTYAKRNDRGCVWPKT